MAWAGPPAAGSGAGWASVELPSEGESLAMEDEVGVGAGEQGEQGSEGSAGGRAIAEGQFVASQPVIGFLPARLRLPAEAAIHGPGGPAKPCDGGRQIAGLLIGLGERQHGEAANRRA